MSAKQQPKSSKHKDTSGSAPHVKPHRYRFKKSDRIADRYEVIAPMGYGGFAEVYHCRDIRLNRDTAVKTLIEKSTGLQEARTAARLKHPCIIQVYDVLKLEDGTPVIVFEYVDGQTLEVLLTQSQYRRLPLSGTTLSVIRQISEALDYAHEQGVIHRDIKPSNIILDQRMNAYLTDFGLSEVKQPSAGESMLTTNIQRRLSGTIPYMAPEQLKGENPGDEHSDLYSLAVVAYEVLTGQLTHRGRDAGLIIQIATSEPIPPTQANTELPAGIEPVLLRALDKDPEKRYASCQAFVNELVKATEAYVSANDQYKQAVAFFEDKRWRQALSAFEKLDREAPGFKDTIHYLEQTRHQVKLLELYEKAEKALEEERYQEALDKLNVLNELDPDYGVEDIRLQAQRGRAKEEKRSLDEQYKQAVQQFQQERYRDCLDTLAVIRERNPDYSDPDGIEAPARKKVKRQQLLHELYNQGIEQTRREEWKKAIATFQKLRLEAPGYEDVENQLAIARHLGRLSSLLHEAEDLLNSKKFAASVDKLDELQRVDEGYKQDEVTQLREDALERLHEQAKRLIEAQEFEKSLTALADLRERALDYPGVEELETQAKEGIRTQSLQSELDTLYQEALNLLRREDYSRALDLWQEVQRRKGDLDYPDPRDVRDRARKGLCGDLYKQALGALSRGDPLQALDLLRKVRKVDPEYPDSQRVEQQAQAKIEQSEKIRWWAIRLGGGAAALILLGVIIAVIARGCGGAVVSTTETPIWTPSPTATSSPTSATPTPTTSPSPTSTTTEMPISSLTPTATEKPSSSPTPTSTRTPTVTDTASPSPTPTTTPTSDNTATAERGAGIFAAPDANSETMDSVSAGERVTVLARSAVGEWFYIRDDQGVEGFVYAPRFEWSGDYESLPVKESPSYTRTPRPTTVTSGGELTMDLWDLPDTARCHGGAWYKNVYIEGHGGDGTYTYYWNGEKLAGPISTSYTFEVHSTAGAVIGTGKVVSGDGQEVERELYIKGIGCSQ